MYASDVAFGSSAYEYNSGWASHGAGCSHESRRDSDSADTSYSFSTDEGEVEWTRPWAYNHPLETCVWLCGPCQRHIRHICSITHQRSLAIFRRPGTQIRQRLCVGCRRVDFCKAFDTDEGFVIPF